MNSNKQTSFDKYVYGALFLLLEFFEINRIKIIEEKPAHKKQIIFQHA